MAEQFCDVSWFSKEIVPKWLVSRGVSGSTFQIKVWWTPGALPGVLLQVVRQGSFFGRTKTTRGVGPKRWCNGQFVCQNFFFPGWMMRKWRVLKCRIFLGFIYTGVKVDGGALVALVRGNDEPIHGSCAIYFWGGIYARHIHHSLSSRQNDDANRSPRWFERSAFCTLIWSEKHRFFWLKKARVRLLGGLSQLVSG